MKIEKLDLLLRELLDKSSELDKVDFEKIKTDKKIVINFINKYMIIF